MCYHQPPPTECMGFHVLAIKSTFLLKQIDLCSVPKPTKEAIVSVPFLKFHFVPEHTKALLHLSLIF